MKVRGDQGDLSSAFQFPHPNKSESILQRGLFIVLYFSSSSSIAAPQQPTVLPYGGRLPLAFAVALCGIPEWRQPSRAPFADPLKDPPAIWRTTQNKKTMQTSQGSCQNVSVDFHRPFHAFIMLAILACVDGRWLVLDCCVTSLPFPHQWNCASPLNASCLLFYVG